MAEDHRRDDDLDDDDYDGADDRCSEEPCDLRLLTPTTCLQELYSHASGSGGMSGSDFRGSPMTSILRSGLSESLLNIMPATPQTPFRPSPLSSQTASATSTPTSSIPALRNIRVATAGGSGGGGGGGATVTTPGGAYTCTRCGNSYARPHSLNRHIRFECGVEPKFECPVCHKKSKHKHNLVLHMRTHQQR